MSTSTSAEAGAVGPEPPAGSRSGAGPTPPPTRRGRAPDPGGQERPGQAHPDQAQAGSGPTARGEAEPEQPEPGQAEPGLPEPGLQGPQPADAPQPEPVERVVPGRVLGASSRSRNPSPFAIGFVGALGVLLAVGLVQAVVQAGQIVTLVFASLFLALSLDPFVGFLERRRLPRPLAVAVTFTLLVCVVVGFIATIAPLVIAESGQLIRVSPIYIRRLEQSEFAQTLNTQFGIFERINAELEARLASSTTIDALFGGVLGAGRAVITGIFSVLVVLILTLYFLASLRSVTAGAYRLVPRSSRARVQEIGEEAQRRVGGYVLGQLAVASLNGILAFVVMSVLDVRYSAALAFAVGVFGLIPLIGATIGAVLACTVAGLGDLGDGIVLAIWFLVYQQVENYLILPRIMSRTVAVPSTLAVVAALVGGSLLGLVGALVAIPLAATALLVVQRVVYPRQERS